MNSRYLLICLGLLPGAFHPATSAFADDLRDFCADRPGLNTPTCVIDRGHVAVETSFADWTTDKNGPVRSDSVVFGSTLVRYGLTDTLELRASWDGYGTSRTRDATAGTTEHDDGGGDIQLSLRQNLRNPDGSGFALAVMPYVTLPAGSDGFSAGDWGAGLFVPVSIELVKNVSLAITPEIDAAVDGDGDGRHLAFGSAIGLGFSLPSDTSITVETQFVRDNDPDGHSTSALLGLAFAWKPAADLQFDAGVVRGLNDDSPDWELYTGIARRF